MTTHWIGGHEPTHGRRIVPSAEVVETALGVAFFAGELVGVDAAVGGVEFAVGKIVEFLDGTLVEAGDEAGGAEVVSVDEVGGGVLVFGNDLPTQVDVTGLHSGSGHFRQDVAVKIVDVVEWGGANQFCHALPRRIVGVSGSGAAVDLSEAVLSVVSVGVGAVIGHVA